MRTLWIAVLKVSSRTCHKLATKHGLDWRDVVEAVEAQPGLGYVWNHHADRGWRVYVEATIAGRVCRLVLYPTGEDDEFNLGSAYPVD